MKNKKIQFIKDINEYIPDIGKYLNQEKKRKLWGTIYKGIKSMIERNKKTINRLLYLWILIIGIAPVVIVIYSAFSWMGTKIEDYDRLKMNKIQAQNIRILKDPHFIPCETALEHFVCFELHEGESAKIMKSYSHEPLKISTVDKGLVYYSNKIINIPGIYQINLSKHYPIFNKEFINYN